MSGASGLRICALPRDPNPYQRLLYTELERLGARVRYVGELTPSRTLNLLLLPAELVARGLAGWGVLHVHWVYGFALPGAGRWSPLRRLSQAWFRVVLATARIAGLRVVWTAHNVLPHERVFHDDPAARRALVRSADLVLAHTDAALEELTALGAKPRAAAVVPHGPFGPGAVAAAADAQPRAGRKLLYFGRVSGYKGVEDLLVAFAALPHDSGAVLTVAGACSDPALRERLTHLATTAGDRVQLRLEHIPDDEVAGLFAAADVVVLPFRSVTTSGTAMLALGHGKPLVVPDLRAFEALPDEAVRRYDGTVPGLTEAIAGVSSAQPEVLAAMSTAAATHAATLSWPDVAARTADAIAREAAQPRPPARTSLWRRLTALAPESLLRNSSYLSANLVIGALGGFISLSLITHLYPTREVGLGVTALSAMALVTTMSQLGLNYSLLRFLPVSRDKQGIANTALTLTALATVLGAGIFLLVPSASGRLYAMGGVVFVLVFLLGNLGVALITQIENVFVAYESSRDVFRANLVTSGLKIVLPAVLLPLAALGVFLTQSLAMAVGFVVLAVVLARRGMPVRPALRLRGTRPLWRFSAGSYLAMVVGSVPLFLLPLIILARFGPEQSAYWYAAIAIAGLLYQLPGCVSQVVLAQASYRTGDRRALLIASSRLIGVTMVPVLVLTYVLAPELLEILGRAYAAASVTTLRWLVVAGVLTTINFVTGTVLYLAKRTFVITAVELVDAVVVLGLSTLWAHNVTQVAVAWTIGEVGNLVLFWLAAAVTVRQHGGRWEALGRAGGDISDQPQGALDGDVPPSTHIRPHSNGTNGTHPRTGSEPRTGTCRGALAGAGKEG